MTVSVPAELQPIFQRAEEAVREYFRDRIDDPSHSTISISGERYLLVRASSISVEFFDLVTSLYRDRGTEEAANVAKNFLYDMAHSIGKADARAFHQRMNLEDPIERLSAGPIHFAYSGWAFVRIHPDSNPVPHDEYYLLYDHPFSFESDAWLARGRRSKQPVCVMNAAYSSGWCAESFGLDLVSVEVECKAAGGNECRFIMAPPSQIERRLDAYAAQQPVESRGHRHSGDTASSVPEYFRRKRLEDELRASRDALERRVVERTAELASANEELRHKERQRKELEQQVIQTQKLESLGVLAGGIAHDFNNLLVGVLGNAGTILADLPESSPFRERIEEIERSSKRAAQLTDQLLAYAGRRSLLKKPLQLNQLISDLGELLGSAISKKTQIHYELGPEISSIVGDETQLRQVVMNLLINASESFGDEIGHIRVSTDELNADRSTMTSVFLNDELPAGRYVRLSVSDDGKGMDEETRSRMFDPFFTTKATGRGLGLAAVLGIVRAHDGTVRVTSAVGEGTKFTLLFPARPEIVVEPPIEQTAYRSGLARGTVLVVDDEELVRSVSTLILEREGYGVIAARDGFAGLDALGEHGDGITGVLLDVTMPGLDGRATLEKIRSTRPALPVILMTGYARDEVVDRFAGLEFDAVVHKPFSVEQLVDAAARAFLTPGSQSR